MDEAVCITYALILEKVTTANENSVCILELTGIGESWLSNLEKPHHASDMHTIYNFCPK